MLTTEQQQAVANYQVIRRGQEAEELERLLKVEFECKCSGFRLCDGCCKSVLAAEVKRLRAELKAVADEGCEATCGALARGPWTCPESGCDRKHYCRSCAAAAALLGATL
jgi:hypothetical protein